MKTGLRGEVEGSIPTQHEGPLCARSRAKGPSVSRGFTIYPAHSRLNWISEAEPEPRGLFEREQPERRARAEAVDSRRSQS